MTTTGPSWDFPRDPLATRLLVEEGQRRGMSMPACLAGTGLQPSDLRDHQGVIDAGTELTVIRNLIDYAGDEPGLGAATAKRITLGMMGIWGFAALSSRTTRELVDIAVRYGHGKLSWSYLRPWIDDRGDDLHLVYDDQDVPVDVRNFLTERDLVWTMSTIPGVYDRSVPMVVATTLTGRRGDAVRAGLPTFTVETGAPRNAVIISASLLDAQLPHADEDAKRISVQQCEEIIARRGHRAGVAARVRAALLRSPTEMPSLAEIALERNVDVRTLRRQLAAENTSYRALADEVRESLAVELLTRAELTVQQTARRVGFSDAASFSRAFQRWTGRSPGSVARAARDEGS